jgi:hypothetical protein
MFDTDIRISRSEIQNLKISDFWKFSFRMLICLIFVLVLLLLLFNFDLYLINYRLFDAFVIQRRLCWFSDCVSCFWAAGGPHGSGNQPLLNTQPPLGASFTPFQPGQPVPPAPQRPIQPSNGSQGPAVGLTYEQLLGA